jgi:hypothetical protein
MDVRHLGLSQEDLRALGYAVGKARESNPAGSAAPRDGQPAPDGPRGPATSGSSSTFGGSARRRWAWTVAILCGIVWAASGDRRLPAPVAANAPVGSFSSARAMTQLVEIAERPHPPGSPEHERVRTWLLERLRSLELDTHVQVAVETFERDGTLHAGTVRNIVVRLPGQGSTGAVALHARYDSSPLSPGAGQAGIGVAAILETLRALKAGQPLRNDLIVVLTDASEHGLGVRAFVEDHPWTPEIDVVLSLAMRGVSGSAVAYAAAPDNGALVRAMAEALPYPASTSLGQHAFSPWLGEGGLGAFVEAGIPAVGLGALGGRAMYGQAIDRPLSVSERTLQHHGAQLVAMTRAFGTLDLRPASALREVDRVYASLPLVGLVDYSAAWTPWVAAGLWAMWALAGLLLWLRRRSMRGVGVGVLLGVVGVAGAAAVGWALFDFVSALHPEHASFDGPYYREGIHLLALASASVAWMTVVYAVARRRQDAAELFVGGLVLPLAAAVVLAVRAPAAAIAFHWPLALAVILAVGLAATTRWARSGAVAWAASLVTATGVLYVSLPALELTAQALTLRAAAPIAAGIALLVLMILPVLDGLSKPRAWWTPALATVSAALLIAVGLPTVQGAARHPLPTALVYLVHDSVGQLVSYEGAPGVGTGTRARGSIFASAALSGDDAFDAGPDAERRLMGDWLVVPGVGEAWARSWVAQPRAEATDPGVLMLSGAGQAGGYVVAGSGPASELAGPSVRIVRSTMDEGTRTVRLEVRSTIGAEMIGIHIPDGMDGALTGVGGKPAGEGPARSRASWRRLTHWGLPEHGVLFVDLLLDAHQTEATLDVLEHHLRPREIMGEYFFARADSLIADASVDSDRLIQRTPVRIFVGGPAS